MASGKAHARASLILAVPTGIVAGISLNSVLVGLGAAVGSVLGIVLTPDLDLLEPQMPWWEEVLATVVWGIFIVAAALRLLGVF